MFEPKRDSSGKLIFKPRNRFAELARRTAAWPEDHPPTQADRDAYVDEVCLGCAYSCKSAESCDKYTS